MYLVARARTCKKFNLERFESPLVKQSEHRKNDRFSTHESVGRLDVGGRHHLERGGPEPAVDLERLEAGLVAALNLLVAQPAGGVHVVKAGLGVVVIQWCCGVANFNTGNLDTLHFLSKIY